jgi:hypothetical protein
MPGVKRLQWLVVWAIEWLCGALDRIPSWESIPLRRYVISGIGCRLHLGLLSSQLDERWKTGVWS